MCLEQGTVLWVSLEQGTVLWVCLEQGTVLWVCLEQGTVLWVCLEQGYFTVVVSGTGYCTVGVSGTGYCTESVSGTRVEVLTSVCNSPRVGLNTVWNGLGIQSPSPNTCTSFMGQYPPQGCQPFSSLLYLENKNS